MEDEVNLAKVALEEELNKHFPERKRQSAEELMKDMEFYVKTQSKLNKRTKILNQIKNSDDGR